jgi:anti-anti-sigma factor
MIAVLRGEIDASLSAGLAGFRVAGEMGWALRRVPGAERLEEYERRVTALFDEGLSAAICQYDTRRFPAERVRRLVGCHAGSVEMDALFHGGPLLVALAYDSAGERVLRVRGTIDRGTDAGWRGALETAAGWGGDVRVDMTDLEFIDVAGLRGLVQAAARLPDGRRLRVRNLAPALGGVVRLVGWDRTPGLVIDEGPPAGGEGGR